MASTLAGEAGTDADPPKTITGYCDRWSLRAGEQITLRASSHVPGPAAVSVVRTSCGDPTKAGPGWSEHPVDTDLPPTVDLIEQPLVPGSYGLVDLGGVAAAGTIELEFDVQCTRPKESQSIASIVGADGEMRIVLDDGLLRVQDVSGFDVALRERPLENRRWYHVSLRLDGGTGELTGGVTTAPSVSPGRDLFELDAVPVAASGVVQLGELAALAFGAARLSPDGAWRGDFDGRIAAPELRVDDTTHRWDLSQRMDSPVMVEVAGSGRDGELFQLPTRAVTGPRWDNSEQRWAHAPQQWDAVHFHKDDLYDAGWDDTVTLTVPADLPSGIYAFLVEADHGTDRVPFFVRPAADAPTNDVALLMSSATYLAYANRRNRLRPEHEYVRTHPEIGRSMYEKHPDGSGMMFSSRLRPVLNLRPGADGWNFTPDTDINAWLEHTGIGHDVIADEDVHAEGESALAPYRTIVTCSHPEYWSTAMLDALAAWQRNGGRLMYLGGNGFYWRVAFSDHWPGAMELRRAEDGVRNWQTGDGESYHAFGGEYGGMWRRNGRPPNELVGIGFAAQGFSKASSYDVNDDSLASRASWIWDGVVPDDGRIGTSGLGGGAAGQELDRYDTRLGSPAHAVVLASATTFGPDMVRTKEEFEGSVIYPDPDPYVRADIVFYETPSGGAVFSVGSISWFGALARNGYDNDVAQMSTNVLRRFADPEPIPPPA